MRRGGSASGGPPGGGSIRAQPRRDSSSARPPRIPGAASSASEPLALAHEHAMLFPPGRQLLPLALHDVRRRARDELLVGELLLLALHHADQPVHLRSRGGRTRGPRRSRRPAARTRRCRRTTPRDRPPARSARRRRARTPGPGATTVARSRSSAQRASPPSVTMARTAWPGCTPYSARIARTAPTSSCTSPNSRSAVGVLGAAVGTGPRRDRDRRIRRPTGETAPQRLGDERHDRMEEPERHVERLHRHRPRDVAARRLAVEPRLDLLDVPVREVAPDEPVDRRGGLVESEPLVRLGGLAHGDLAAGDDPPVGQGELAPAHHGRGSGRPSGRGGPSRLPRMNRPAFHSLLAKLRPGAEGRLEVVGIEDDVGAHRHARHQRVAERVGAVAPHHLERIDPVARATWTSCGAGCRAPSRAGTSGCTAARP